MKLTYRFASLTLSVIAAFAVAYNAATEAIGRAVDWMLSALQPEPFDLRDDMPRLALDTGLETYVEPALRNALRHEAGMRRRDL